MTTTAFNGAGGAPRKPVIFKGSPDTPGTTTVQVLIHTRRALDDHAVQEIMHTLTRLDGIIEIRFNPDKEHLIMPIYDPRRVASSRLLAAVRKLGHDARLVGL